MKRYLSLDVLRGLAVALMIMVNNPGSWHCSYSMLQHSTWDGCTLCDLVFPCFLFCVGTSMAFAFDKYSSLNRNAFRKILKRGVLLYVSGLLLTAFPFYNVHPDPALSFVQNWLEWLNNLRLVSVLSRIAVCYVAAAMLVQLHAMSDGLFSRKQQLMDSYRSRCITLGQQISLVRGNALRHGTAVDVDADGALVVDFGGHLETVSSGEVSVRGMYGYV